jgi:hypothetical protein
MSASAGGLHLPEIKAFKPLRSASQILQEKQKALQLSGIGAVPVSKKESLQEEEQQLKNKIANLEKKAGEAEFLDSR